MIKIKPKFFKGFRAYQTYLCLKLLTDMYIGKGFLSRFIMCKTYKKIKFILYQFN